MIKKKIQENGKKGLLIRYDLNQKKLIEKLMFRFEEKTMSKAFLRAPAYIESLHSKINAQCFTIEQLQKELEELKSIVSSWAQFYNKLETFVKKR